MEEEKEYQLNLTPMASSFVNRGFATFKTALNLAPGSYDFVEEMAKR